MPSSKPRAIRLTEGWAQEFMAAVEAGRMIDRSGLAYSARPPESWPGELEAARACWRKHGEPRRVRWQVGRWRPCPDCLDDLRTSLPGSRRG